MAIRGMPTGRTPPNGKQSAKKINGNRGKIKLTGQLWPRGAK